MNYLKKKFQYQKLEIPQGKYIKIQFLTKQQKIKKNIALQKFYKDQQKCQESDEIVIHNLDGLYRVSFREKLCFKTLNTIKMDDIYLLLENKQQYKTICQFYQKEVAKIDQFCMNNKKIQPNQNIQLLSYDELLQNDQTKILQIIYVKKTFFQKFKKNATKAIISIPSLIFQFIKGLITIIIRLMGFGSISSGVYTGATWLFGKQILYGLLEFLSYFFPPLKLLSFAAKHLG